MVQLAERKLLFTEMGSEPLEPEETDEVINEIQFDDSGLILQDGRFNQFFIYEPRHEKTKFLYLRK